MQNEEVVSTDEVADAALDAEVQTDETQDNPAKPEVDAPEQPAKKGGVEKRIDELTRLRRQAERESEYWRELALSKKAEAQAEPAPASTGKPTLEAFEYDQEKYAEALVDWKVSERLKAAEEAKAKQTQEEQQKTVRSTFAERQNAAMQKYEDYADVAFNVPLSKPMEDAIMRMENGPDVAYYLGSNPEKAAEIRNMEPVHQVIALARIEAGLEKPNQMPERPKPQITKAPPPPSSVNANSPVSKDPEKMTIEEWTKWRNSQLRKAKA